MAVVEPGQRVARHRPRTRAQPVERLDMADDRNVGAVPGLLQPQMMRDAAAIDRAVGEGRDAPILAQARDGMECRPHPHPTKQALRRPARHLGRALRQAARARQRGADRQRRRTPRRPAPAHLFHDRRRGGIRHRSPSACEPLGMAGGEPQRLREFALREGGREIVRRTRLVRGGDRGGLAPPGQEQQRSAIRLHRIGEHARRRQSLGQRIARVDHRDGGATGEKMALQRLAPPHRDGRPARPLGHARQLFPLPE